MFALYSAEACISALNPLLSIFTLSIADDEKLLDIKSENLDEKTKPITFGKTKKKLLGLLPGGKLINNLLNSINLELGANGQILWLYKP